MFQSLNDLFPGMEMLFSACWRMMSILLWLTTNAEMYHIDIPLDGAAPKIHTYTVDDGLQDHMFNRNSCFKGADGKLFLRRIPWIEQFLS